MNNNRDIFRAILQSCEEAAARLRETLEPDPAAKEALNSLCERALEAYFWENRDSLLAVLAEVRAFLGSLLEYHTASFARA